MFIIDSHLDLGLNALHWNRDLKLPLAELRESEAGMEGKGRGGSTLSLPELRRAEVGICFCTVLARVKKPNSPSTGYRDHDIAYAFAQGELAYYHQLERQSEFKLLKTWSQVDECADRWLNRATDAPYPMLGGVLTMEGADPVVNPEQVWLWWEDGLRGLSLVHYGISKYAHGTGTEGPLFPEGRALLREMEKIGMPLDTTHLSDQSFFEALEVFSGRVYASHNNCRAICPGERQFSDEQVKMLIEREAVIGVALDAWMLYPGWIKGETLPEVVGLDALVDNIDHICQLAGNTRHVAIGTDLDGGYGKEQVPRDLDTITDLQKLVPMLYERGYSDADIQAIFHGNWLRFLKEVLPQ